MKGDRLQEKGTCGDKGRWLGTRALPHRTGSLQLEHLLEAETILVQFQILVGFSVLSLVGQSDLPLPEDQFLRV